MDPEKPCLCITGPGAGAVRAALLAKLVPPVEVIRTFTVETDADSADVVEKVSAHDSPDFAAEKILDALAGRNWVRFHETALTPEEERALRDRLFDLGYIE